MENVCYHQHSEQVNASAYLISSSHFLSELQSAYYFLSELQYALFEPTSPGSKY